MLRRYRVRKKIGRIFSLLQRTEEMTDTIFKVESKLRNGEYKGYTNYITYLCANTAIQALYEYDLDQLQGLVDAIRKYGEVKAFEDELQELIEYKAADYNGELLEDTICQYGYLNIDYTDAAEDWAVKVQEQYEDQYQEEQALEEREKAKEQEADEIVE